MACACRRDALALFACNGGSDQRLSPGPQLRPAMSRALPAPIRPNPTLRPQVPAALATSTRTLALAGTWPPSPTPRPSLLAPAGGQQLGRGCRMLLGGVWLKRKHVCFLLISQRCMQITTSALTLAPTPLLPTWYRRCYEVRCDPRSQVIDGYRNPYDRSSACKAGSASVVVRTVDNCEFSGWHMAAAGLQEQEGVVCAHVQAGVPARLPA